MAKIYDFNMMSVLVDTMHAVEKKKLPGIIKKDMVIGTMKGILEDNDLSEYIPMLSVVIDLVINIANKDIDIKKLRSRLCCLK